MAQDSSTPRITVAYRRMQFRVASAQDEMNDRVGFVAVTIPGGYSGSGPTPNDACASALARLLAARAYALKAGVSNEQFWLSTKARATSMLGKYLVDQATQRAKSTTTRGARDNKKGTPTVRRFDGISYVAFQSRANFFRVHPTQFAGV